MKLNGLLVISTLLLAAAAVCGCNDDEDETSLYLEGTIDLSIDQYVEVGYTKTFNVDTLLHVTLDDGVTTEGIGYAYKLPLASARDTIKTVDGDFTTKTFTVEAPDSLNTFTFMLIAFAEGYYETYTAAAITVIRPGLNGEKTTLTGYDLKSTDQKFTDERDGREYLYTEKNGLQWMRQNLSWEGSGIAYYDCSGAAVSTIFGRYYTWDEAKNVCPEGWRLPTDKDWCSLASSCGVTAKEGKDISGFAGKLMENIYFNGERMWEYWREVKIDNAAGLSAAPFGYVVIDEDGNTFNGFDKYAAFWTDDEVDGLGVYRYINDETDTFFYGTADKDCFAASVRCVRDTPTL